MSNPAPEPGDWWLFQRLSFGEREDRLELQHRETLRSQQAWAAYQFVEESVERGGEEALEVVLRLLDAAPPEKGHATVGAGPLEDLVNDHGNALADSIDELARRRPDFAACLATVAVDESTLQPDTVRRLSRWLRTD